MSTITAQHTDDTWTAIDEDGGRWWPSEEAEEEIEESSDPAATVVRIATEEPMRGVWHQ